MVLAQGYYFSAI